MGGRKAILETIAKSTERSVIEQEAKKIIPHLDLLTPERKASIIDQFVASKDPKAIYQIATEENTSAAKYIASLPKDTPLTPPKVVTPIDVQKVLARQTAEQLAARGETGVYSKLKEAVKTTKNKIVDFTSPITDAFNAGKKSDPALKASVIGDVKSTILFFVVLTASFSLL